MNERMNERTNELGVEKRGDGTMEFEKKSDTNVSMICKIRK